MKKKPPPGATLIARLKEKRLQRESFASEESSPVLDVEARELEGEEKLASASKSEESTSVEIAVRESQLSTADLFQRSILIDDLRPDTDDYDALTEEIRLAGRFAAIGLIAQGLRLARIRHAEIHKTHYTSFEEYCRKEHQMSATYAYRLIRMSELAEKLAERPALESGRQGPDPYEQMLNLGHRHLMALLPLPETKVEEFLLEGIPLIEGSIEQRVPIEKATEKQIKQALKVEGIAGSAPSMEKRAEKIMGKELPRLLAILEECANWLDESPAELELARMERGQDLQELRQRFEKASSRIIQALSQRQ